LFEKKKAIETFAFPRIYMRLRSEALHIKSVVLSLLLIERTKIEYAQPKLKACINHEFCNNAKQLFLLNAANSRIQRIQPLSSNQT